MYFQATFSAFKFSSISAFGWSISQVLEFIATGWFCMTGHGTIAGRYYKR
jgi:hypothetical protein